MLELMLRHVRMAIEHKGEYTGICEMRAHIAWYTGGFPNSARLRREVNAVESREELERLLRENFPLQGGVTVT